MHGVPADLPLQPFVGDECSQICIGRFQLQFHFGRAGRISVEGKWELRDAAGTIIDHSLRQGSAEEPATRETYRIQKIIDVSVSRFSIDAPTSFTLYFANGCSLTLYDDPSQSYESIDVNGIII
jgi:hypothetical protein